jgi:hypothetical protein
MRRIAENRQNMKIIFFQRITSDFLCWLKECAICSGEMLNLKLNAKRGFHPRRCGSPDAITPEQVLRHHRSAQGRHGGTGTVPSFIRTSILNFISMDKEFNRTVQFASQIFY